jgi:maltose O-acetyltransferase
MLDKIWKFRNLLSLESGFSPFFFHGVLRILWRMMDFIPFKASSYGRHWIGRRMFNNLGENSGFRDHNIFADGRNIEIGNNFISGRYNYFGGGFIKIGHDVLMANFIIIETTNHFFSDISKPIRTQGFRRLSVEIEDDVWIGNRVTILPGVKIGKGAVLASGSVVTKSVEPYCVVAGVPSKVIKRRN